MARCTAESDARAAARAAEGGRNGHGRSGGGEEAQRRAARVARGRARLSRVSRADRDAYGRRAVGEAHRKRTGDRTCRVDIERRGRCAARRVDDNA